MSKVGGAGRAGAAQNHSAVESPQNQAGAQARGGNSVYVANNDSAGEKFNARTGIERGGGRGNGHKNAHAHNHRGKHRGDEVRINVEGVEQRGRVIGETADQLIVVVGDEVFYIDKNTGDSRRNRKATESEIKDAQQLQEMQEAQQKQMQEAQEQRSQEIKETITDNNRKYDARQVERKKEIRSDEVQAAERKKEIRLDEAQAVERGTTKKIDRNVVRQDQNKSINTQFQMHTPEVLHETLSVPEIIRAKMREEELKKT